MIMILRMSDFENLKPCPFCGSKKILLVDDPEEKNIFFSCEVCQGHSPIVKYNLDDTSPYPIDSLKMLWNGRYNEKE